MIELGRLKILRSEPKIWLGTTRKMGRRVTKECKKLRYQFWHCAHIAITGEQWRQYQLLVGTSDPGMFIVGYTTPSRRVIACQYSGWQSEMNNLNEKCVSRPSPRSTDITEVSAEQWSIAGIAGVVRAGSWRNILSRLRRYVWIFGSQGGLGATGYGILYRLIDQTSCKGKAAIP